MNIQHQYNHVTQQQTIADVCDANYKRICDRHAEGGENRGCFRKIDGSLIAFGKQSLNASKVHIWLPDPNYNNLPFPSSFNRTIVQTKSMLGCENEHLNCHDMTQDGCDSIYMCHTLKNTNVFRVYLKDEQQEQDDTTFMPVTCHYDTADWNPNHLSMKALNKKPGDIICHFMPKKNFVVCKKI